ncbi:hypothetical protein M758_UG267800 [Ceratodon purpureus]|nr:hypothetical protein M758_UG267800 [Ceratodon purpureus]
MCRELGKMGVLATMPGSIFTELPIWASSSRFTIPVCIGTIRGRRFCSSWLRVSDQRCARTRSGVVVCCNGDGNNHEGSDERGSSWDVGSKPSEVSRLHAENSELRASLAELSKSLASISGALAEVSRAVELVARAVDCGPSENGGFGVSALVASPAPEIALVPEISRSQEALSPFSGISSSEKAELEGIQDPVQAQLMEQNMKAHNLAYRLQQAFFQARIEGLGKPFQLAVEDFVATCLEAHAMGIGLKELQLQLILLEGSLAGAFAIRNQRHSDDPVMSEESRVRSSWVRLVYTTLAEVKERRSWVEYAASDFGKEREQLDPSDDFVRQLVTLAFEQGYDLERVKLEQNVAGPVTSVAIKTMRQCTYLVLLSLQKITNDAL